MAGYEEALAGARGLAESTRSVQAYDKDNKAAEIFNAELTAGADGRDQGADGRRHDQPENHRARSRPHSKRAMVRSRAAARARTSRFADASGQAVPATRRAFSRRVMCAAWWCPCHAYNCTSESSVIGPRSGDATRARTPARRGTAAASPTARADRAADRAMASRPSRAHPSGWPTPFRRTASP